MPDRLTALSLVVNSEMQRAAAGRKRPLTRPRRTTAVAWACADSSIRQVLLLSKRADEQVSEKEDIQEADDHSRRPQQPTVKAAVHIGSHDTAV